MNRNLNSQPDNLNQDNLDRILLDQDKLLPSSGFAASVMDALQQQASAPPPIPFPWKWALPGFAAILAALIFLMRYILTTVGSMNQNPVAAQDLLAWFGSNSQTAVVLRTEAGPALLALIFSYACIAICRRMAMGGSQS